jgi:type II secretory pathway component PulF
LGKALEPILLIVLGTMLAIIMVAIMFPIYNMIGKIK